MIMIRGVPVHVHDVSNHVHAFLNGTAWDTVELGF